MYSSKARRTPRISLLGMGPSRPMQWSRRDRSLPTRQRPSPMPPSFPILYPGSQKGADRLRTSLQAPRTRSWSPQETAGTLACCIPLQPGDKSRRKQREKGVPGFVRNTRIPDTDASENVRIALVETYNSGLISRRTIGVHQNPQVQD